jgi:hypothetical protein
MREARARRQSEAPTRMGDDSRVGLQHECDDDNYRRDETASDNADRRPKELQSSKRVAVENRQESGAGMPAK